MNTFSVITSEELINKTNAHKTIPTNIGNQNNENYDGLIEIQGKNKIIEHERQSRHDFYEQVSRYKKIIKSSEITSAINDVKIMEISEIANAEMTLNEIKSDLRIEETNKRKQVVELTNFRERNNITYEANYPENRNKLAGTILIFGVVEAILNAFFLSKASEFGLAGGFAMAVGIAALNVLFAFFMSRSIVNAHHTNSKKSILAFISLTVCVSVVFVMALFIGHYRAALDLNVENASFQAVTNILDAPFGITTWDSWMLVAITIAIFSFVTWKFYHNDDPYPQYGDIDRKTKQAIKKYGKCKTKANNLVKNIRIDLTKSIEQKYEVVNKLSHTINQNEDSIEQLIRDYKVFITQQTLEFDAFCKQCRQIFFQNVEQILGITANMSIEQQVLIFEDFETPLTKEDIERITNMKQLINNFVEVEYNEIKSNFLKASNSLTLGEGIKK
jgi:hypothetical protein